MRFYITILDLNLDEFKKMLNLKVLVLEILFTMA